MFSNVKFLLKMYLGSSSTSFNVYLNLFSLNGDLLRESQTLYSFYTIKFYFTFYSGIYFQILVSKKLF